MPVHPCTEDGAPGAKWGSRGKCYTYGSGTGRSRGEAIQAAIAQGRAAGGAGAELEVVGFSEIDRVTVIVERGADGAQSQSKVR